MPKEFLDRVRVHTPATTANIGPGFDCLGMAIELYNEVEMSIGGGRRLTIEAEGTAQSPDMALDERNLVYRAALRVFEVAGVTAPELALRLKMDVPHSRGLGSSAAAIVGGMTAANTLIGSLLEPQDLIKEMVRMEGHPDNVIACMYGGLTVSLMIERRVVHHRYLPAPNIRCVLVIPDYELPTQQARRALPHSVPLRDAVFNLARIPFVIQKLTSGDLSGLAGFMDDRLHQPYRRPLIREYDMLCGEAEEAGAAAVCLSGAGPTILAITDGAVAERVAAALRSALQAISLEAKVVICKPDCQGLVVQF